MAYAKALNNSNNTNNPPSNNNQTSISLTNNNNNKNSDNNKPTSAATNVWQKKRDQRSKSADNSMMTDANSSNQVKEPSPHGSVSSDNPYAMENFAKNPKLQKKVQRQSSIASNKKPPTSDAKSPLSQVRLTPLFPAQHVQPQQNQNQTQNGTGPNYQTLIRNTNAPQFIPHSQQQQSHPRQQQQQQRMHGHNQQRVNIREYRAQGSSDSAHCPHGNLSAEELINIKIRKRNVCYVVGLPIHVATEIKLRSNEWFGQFGNIATIAINRNSKSIQANSIPAHITYDNDISALNAINFCNKFIFNDGRKLKATFGTQHYCRWFIAANKKCTNVFCGFRHSWCRHSDIITQKDIADFKAIPAGAYTSRNIENQPMGLRSDSFSAHHMNGGTVTTVTHSVSHPGSANVTPNMANLHISDPMNTGMVVKSEEIVTMSEPETKSEETKQNSDNLKINAPDPYTFYLSNSAATPTGPSPISHPQHHSMSPTMVPIQTASHLANTQQIGTVNVAQVQPRMNPNIYDSRNALMQQIMNRNASQQIEIDNLKQQMRVLTELEMKNKSELHRYWSNEKALKQRVETAVSDYKKLEAKHDSLQIKYLALNGKYKQLLNATTDDKLQHFESWKSEDVIRWIMALDDGKYGKYEKEFSENVKMENVDGQCLSSLDKGDLHRLGVTDFKDKKDLMLRIREL